MLKPDPFAVAGLDPELSFAGLNDHAAIALAVSGGPDSLALMLLVRAWCGRQGGGTPKVIVYSVDHQLRPESTAEAAEVVRLAEGLGFAGRMLHWAERKPGTGVQAAARAARYRLMGKAMAADGAKVLLTAHHRDDQAETMLMRMAHGSGVSGLGGMREWAEVEGVCVHRPLLLVSRERLHAVVAQAGLTAFADPSNADEKYERTRWRQALPELSGLGLSAERLTRLARRIQRADVALSNAAKASVAAHVENDQFGVAHIGAIVLSELDDEIALRVLGQMMAAVSPDGPGLEQLEDLLPQARQKGFSGTSLAGALIEGRKDEVLAYREAGRMQVAPVSLSPREKMIWDGRFEFANESGQVIEVRTGFELSRRAAEGFAGVEIDVPMAAVRALPLAYHSEGEWVALGTLSKMPQLRISNVAANQVGTA